MTQWEGTATRRRRYGALPILAAVVVAMALGRFAAMDSAGPEDLEVAAATESPSPTPRPRPTRSPRPSPSPTPSSTPVGSWRVLEPEPFPGRYNTVTLWTGRHLVVWGGHRAQWPKRSTLAGDGAMWNPRKRRWSRIPPAPVPQRHSSAAAWTGDSLFIWGGTDAAGHRADGAMYHPAKGWTVVPTSPLSARHGAAAVRAGDEVLVVGGWDNLGLLRDGAAYHLRTGQWRMLPPLPEGVGEGLQATRTRQGPMFWTQNFYGEPVAAMPLLYDRRQDRWRRVLDPRPAGGMGFAAVTAVRGDLYGLSATSPLTVRRLRVDGDEWELIRTLPEDGGWSPQLLAAGPHLFLLNINPTLTGHRLDTRTMEWVTLPREQSAWQEFRAAWTGRELLVRGLALDHSNNVADDVVPRFSAWRPGTPSRSRR